MQIDRISLSQGSALTTFAAATGPVLPLNAAVGELFYKNVLDSSRGLYVFNGTVWELAGGGTGFTISGDVSGVLDGGVDVLSLNTVGTPGTYTKVTTNSKGLVISGSNPTTLAGYGIVDALSVGSDLSYSTSTTELSWTGVSNPRLAVGPGKTLNLAATQGSVHIQGSTFTESSSDLGTISGSVTMSLKVGNLISFTIGGPLSLSFNNLPDTSKVATFLFEITNGGIAALTWPINIEWVSGAAPTLRIAGKNLVGIITRDGGTTFLGTLVA